VALAGRRASRRTSKVVHCYTTNSSVKKSGDDDVELLQFLTPFMPPTVFSISVMSLM
jgi:hypothetical protein